MSKYLSFIQLYSDEKMHANFDSELLQSHYHCIQLINYNLARIEAHGVERINVILTSNKFKNHNIDTASNIIDIFFFLDINVTSIKAILNNYLVLLNLLKKSEGWVGEIDLILEKIRNKNYKLEDYFNKKKWNTNRKISCRIFFKTFSINSIEFQLHVFNGDNKLLNSVNFLQAACGIMVRDIIKYYIGKISWADDTTVRVQHSNVIDYWDININGEINFHFDRVKSGSAHAEFDLGMMYFYGNGVLQNKKLAEYWLKKAADKKFKKAEKFVLDNNIAH